MRAHCVRGCIVLVQIAYYRFDVLQDPGEDVELLEKLNALRTQRGLQPAAALTTGVLTEVLQHSKPGRPRRHGSKKREELLAEFRCE